MNWESVGSLLLPLAPTIGSIVGGFIPIPGAGLAGGLVGKGVQALLAAKLGVPATPEAVTAAIKGTPYDILVAKLNAVTEEAKVQWPAVAEIEKAQAAERAIYVTQVNETMRAELGSDSLFKSGWRPACGWVLVYLITVVGTVMVAALIQIMFTGNAAAWDKFVAALPSVCLFLAIPAAVCGITAFGRSWEKSAAYKVGGLGNEVTTTIKAVPPPRK